MAGQLSGQPIYILREGSQRTKGKEAQHNNIMAAMAELHNRVDVLTEKD